LNESELWDLLKEIRTETDKAREEGYLPLDVGNALLEAENLLNKYRETKGWKGGYWGRSANYEMGFEIGRESMLLQARESLLRAKGALISLKLPRWAKELRYYYMDPTWGKESVEGLDRRRGVAFMAGNEWALSGFPESQVNFWNRCNCRPTKEGIDLIEKFHEKGIRVGTYMSGGMMIMTYALLPDSEDDWTDDFMRWYAGNYWHGERERFWGARGTSSEWRGDEPRPLDFSAWMMKQLEFAQRIGFDFVHLDEAFGAYPEARELSERDPDFVMCPNNLARMYVDEKGWRFGWTAMGESLGHPSEWDEFNRKMRQRSMQARNIPWWGWHTYEPFEQGYHDLTLATSLANRGTDVSHSNPSEECIEFTREFSDYVYGPYVDTYVSQDIVRPLSPHKSLRVIVDRRVMLGDREELIVHLLNIDPSLKSISNIELEVDPAGIRMAGSPTVTLLAPAEEPRTLKAKPVGRKLQFAVPKIGTWGVVVVGEQLFPQVEVRLAKRAGVPVNNPLDNGFVPGKPLQVEVQVSSSGRLECTVDLHLPSGWEYAKIRTDGNTHVYEVVPLFAHRGKGYAITPLVTKDGVAAPSWPLVLHAKDEVDLRLVNPLAESPGVTSIHELEITNYGSPGEIKVKIGPLDGWTIEGGEFKLQLETGGAKKVTFSATPKDYHLRFLDQLDVDLPAEWEAHGIRGTTALKIRVFPAKSYVWSKGVDRRIMHSYPNLYCLDSAEEAKSKLKKREHVAVWLVNQNPSEMSAVVDDFVGAGAGVVWMGEPFSGDNCPVRAEGGELTPKFLKYLEMPGEKEDKLLGPAKRKRALFESEAGFRAVKVKPKGGGKVIAVWPKTPQSKVDDPDTFPAVVISGISERRVAYIGSDLETTLDENYRFEDRNHHESHWYQTYALYLLLCWAAGAYNL